MSLTDKLNGITNSIERNLRNYIASSLISLGTVLSSYHVANAIDYSVDSSWIAKGSPQYINNVLDTDPTTLGKNGETWVFTRRYES